MLGNALQLCAVLIVFILVLAATYYVTKWVAKSGAIQPHSKNIKVIETFKIAPNKYIQIIQLGDQFYSIGVTKENITFLTPLTEEQLDFTEKENSSHTMNFRDVLNRFTKADSNNKKEK